MHEIRLSIFLQHGVRYFSHREGVSYLRAMPRTEAAVRSTPAGVLAMCFVSHFKLEQ